MTMDFGVLAAMVQMDKNILIFLLNNKRISFIVFNICSDLFQNQKRSSHLIVP